MGTNVVQWSNFEDQARYQPVDGVIPTVYSLDDFSFLARIEAENAARHVVTANGNAGLDGSGGISLDGTGDYLSIPDSADFDFGGLYSFQCKINRSIDQTGEIASKLTGSTGWKIEYNHSTGKVDATLDSTVLNSTTSIALSTDYDIGLFDDGVTVRLAIDGVVEDSTASVSITANAIDLTIGTSFGGAISRVQIDAGVARQTGNYTVPTGAIVVDSFTVLALNFAGTAASTRIIDSATPADTGEIWLLPDASGNEEDLIAISSVVAPKWVSADGSIRFDSDQLNNYSLTSDLPCTVYIVANVDIKAGTQNMWRSETPTVESLNITTDGYLQISSSLTITDSINHREAKRLFTGVFNVASSAIYANGTATATGTLGSSTIVGGYKIGGPTNMNFYACFVYAGTYNADIAATINNKYNIY